MSDITNVKRSMVGIVALTVAMAPGWAFVSFLGFAFNEQLGLSRTVIGVLAAGISVGYVSAAIPFAVRIDKSAGHWSLTRAPLVLSAGFLVVAATGTTLLLGSMTLLAGGLWAGSVAALNRFVYHIAPSERQGVLFGITQTTVMLSSAIGSFALPSIAAAFGWRWAIATLAVVAAIGGSLAGSRLPRSAVESTRSEAPVRTGPADSRLPSSYFWLLGYGVLMGAAMHDAFAFTLLYLRDAEGLSPTAAGAGLGLLFVGGAFGRSGWGFALDGGWSAFHLLTLSSVGAATAVASILLLSGSGAWVIAPIFALGVLLLGHNTAFILLGMRVSPRRRAGVVAAGLTVSHVLGGIIGPPLFGAIVDITGSYQNAWLTTLAFLIASTAPLTVVWKLT